jgi:WD40 repeat protein
MAGEEHGNTIPLAQGKANYSPPIIPDHEMIRCIGEGSYGAVWLARNIMGEPRAVKVVHRSRFREDAHAYEREFKGIRLYEPISRSHESLVPVLHVGRDDAEGYFYYVMELADDVNGQRVSSTAAATTEEPGGRVEPLAWAATYEPKTLRSELKKRGRLPPDDCVAFGVALATALEQLHKNGLKHRDIKPSNIVFIHGRPMLADIGLVTDMEASLSFVGTWGYVPVEGFGTVSGDIFSLGKVLYEICTGLDRAQFPALPDLARFAEPERKKLRELNAVLVKACAQKVEQRHKSATELREELIRLQIGESIQRQRALERAYGKMKLVVPAVLLTACVAALLVGTWYYRGRMALRESLIAQAQSERKIAHKAGWYSNNWAIIERSAGIQKGTDVMTQAAGALTGIEATEIYDHRGGSAGSAAFAGDGALLLGGADGGHSILVLTNREKRELPGKLEGPVCWPSGGTPLQLSIGSNCCVVSDPMTAKVHWTLGFGDGEALKFVDHGILAISADGTHAAAAVNSESTNGFVVWNISNGQTTRVETKSVTCLAFNSDGTILAVGNTNAEVHVYSTSDMKEVGTLGPPADSTGEVRCLALSRQGLVRQNIRSAIGEWSIAAGYKGAELVIWDLSTRQIRSHCRGSNWSVVSLAFHPGGLILASGARPEVRLWDVMTGEQLLQILVHVAGDCRALAFSADGLRLAWGTQSEELSGCVGVSELSIERGIHVLHGLRTNVRGVWFSPDSRLVAGLADNWRLGVWETASGRVVNIFEVPPGALADCAGVAFDAAGRNIAFAAGFSARLYELNSGKLIDKWAMDSSGLYDQLAFDSDGRLLFLRRSADDVPRDKKRWRLYELSHGGGVGLLHEQIETNWVPERTALPAGAKNFFVWSADSAKSNAQIKCFEVSSGKEMWQLTTPGLTESVVRLDPTGQWFGYNVDLAGSLSIVRSSDFKARAKSPDYCAAIGPSGTDYCIGNDRGFAVYNHACKPALLPLGEDFNFSFDAGFSPDGKYLAWGTKEGAVLLAEIDRVRKKLAAMGR